MISFTVGQYSDINCCHHTICFEEQEQIDVDNEIWWGNLRMGNLRERDHWGDPGIDGRIMLRLILRKWDVGYGLD
jgi:hypothetical protein